MSAHLHIDDALLHHLSELSLLEFDEQTKQAMKVDLQGLVTFCEQINSFDEKAYESYLSAKQVPLAAPLRKDEVGLSLDKKSALAAAALQNGDFFLVPKVISS